MEHQNVDQSSFEIQFCSCHYAPCLMEGFVSVGRKFLTMLLHHLFWSSVIQMLIFSDMYTSEPACSKGVGEILQTVMITVDREGENETFLFAAAAAADDQTHKCCFCSKSNESRANNWSRNPPTDRPTRFCLMKRSERRRRCWQFSAHPLHVCGFLTLSSELAIFRQVSKAWFESAP